MGRSASSVDDSLELLLDTICNAFGGILFLAMLVCLLTQQASDGLPTPEQADVASTRVRELGELREQLAGLEEEIESLDHGRRQQVILLGSLGHVVRDGASVAALNAIRDVEEQWQRNQLLSTLLVQQDDALTQSNQEVASAQERVRQQAAKAASARQQAAEHRRANAVTVRLPVAHATDTIEVPVALSNGRLYMIYSYEGTRQLGMNLRDVRQQDEDSFTLIPGRGAVVGNRKVPNPEAVEVLKSFTSTRYYVARVSSGPRLVPRARF
jgi:hypothetical protein